jgi:hypothetical protein
MSAYTTTAAAADAAIRGSHPSPAVAITILVATLSTALDAFAFAPSTVAAATNVTTPSARSATHVLNPTRD